MLIDRYHDGGLMHGPEMRFYLKLKWWNAQPRSHWEHMILTPDTPSIYWRHRHPNMNGAGRRCEMTQLYNVVAVNLKNYSRRLIAEGKTERNADAIVQMAVMRRGVEEEIFVAEPVAALASQKDTPHG